MVYKIFQSPLLVSNYTNIWFELIIQKEFEMELIPRFTSCFLNHIPFESDCLSNF